MTTRIDSSLMMTKYQWLFVVYLVVILIYIGGTLGIQPAFGFGQDHKSRQTRSNKFIEGPNGHLCILNQEGGGDKRYDIISEDGTTLTCDVCAIGKVLVSNCTSDRLTDCRWLEPGEQRMPHPNICTSGYPCKNCSSPSQTVKTPCNPRGRERDDTECQCAEDYYSTNHEADMCNPLPRCSKGFAPRSGAGADGVAEKICQKCGDGFYQPNDNSTELCRKHTDCIETPGTHGSDNICKGNPQISGSPATSPNEGASSVPPPTSPCSCFMDLVPGSTNSTSKMVTDPSNKTGVPSNDKTNPRVLQPSIDWTLIVIRFCTHIVAVVVGMLLMWCIVVYCRKKEGNIEATNQESTELQTMRTISGSVAVNIPSSDEEGPTLFDLGTKKGRREFKRKRMQRGGNRAR